MKTVNFSVAPEIEHLDIPVATASILGVTNQLSSAFDLFVHRKLSDLGEDLAGANIEESQIFRNYRGLHSAVSAPGFTASPEVLLRSFLEKNRFPRINPVVDIYNLVSLRTRLALGAHDLSKISGNVSFRLTHGDENFLPLGKKMPVAVPRGVYAYIDEGANRVLCLMEVLQCEETKIMPETKDVFLIAQGNNYFSKSDVAQAINQVHIDISTFCGGAMLIE